MTLLELEDYFAKKDLPKSIRLDKATFVSDVRKLVEANISTLKAHPGNKSFMPYYDQLIDLVMAIEAEREI